MEKFIDIKGARVNNLKDVSLKIPINKLTCFFGPSGSGKTSIAFHTLFSESKRRFLNSFPNYLKFFSERPAPVDVDEIMPVLPVFGLPQNNPVVGARSNVSDTMHLTDIFQSLFYYHGQQRCRVHGKDFQEYKISDALSDSISEFEDDKIVYVLLERDSFIDFFKDSPFPSRSLKSRRSKKISDFDKDHEFWEVARFKKGKANNIDEKLKPYIEKDLTLILLNEEKKKILDFKFKKNTHKCPEDGCAERAIEGKSMLHFSPYNPLGACGNCGGFGENLEYDEDKLWDVNKSVKEDGVLLLNYKRFGTQKDKLIKVMKKLKISTDKPIGELPKSFFELLYLGEGDFLGFDHYFSYLDRKRYKMNVRIFVRNIQKSVPCSVCEGTRLGSHSKQFFLSSDSVSLFDLTKMDITSLENYFSILKLKSKEAKTAVKKIKDILESATGIGLGHLSTLRKSKTVSAGEYQRLLLLKYLSYEGVGSLFVFDEPSLGLSLKEKKSLLKGFEKLINQQNTVVIIDHGEFFQDSADFLVEMGPGSGKKGGHIEYMGEGSKYKRKVIEHGLSPLKHNSKREWLELKGTKIYGKSYQDIKLPLDEITWVRGPSGCGKTSVLINTLANYLTYRKEGSYLNIEKGKFEKLKCDVEFDDVIIVDANLNRYTSRSSVGSMTDFFPVVRKHFAKTSMAKALGLKDGHFSYHSELGQCPKCAGRGVIVVEMQFLEDIVLTCEDCGGKRLKPIYAEVSDGERTVHEAFSLPMSEVIPHLKLTPKYQRIYEYIKILNLDYLALNRGINSLSGGEKQRIYLLNKLQKDISNSILFFENISFGLSAIELAKVGEFLQNLSAKNNTIIIIDQDEFFKNVASNTLNFSD